jgi:hypothetical protein
MFFHWFKPLVMTKFLEIRTNKKILFLKIKYQRLKYTDKKLIIE